MPGETFQNRSGDNPISAPYVSTEADLANLHQAADERLEVLFNEVRHLRSRLGWITGLAVASLILAGVLAGLTISVKLRQDRQVQQVGSLTSDKAGVENQVNSLNQQLVSLNQQMTSLNQQVALLNQQLPQKVSQAQLKPLLSIVQELNSKAVTRDQLNAALQRVQQPQLNNEGPSLTPSPSLPASP
jgi:septal ring factor EnvC (AmiA/AmiB activator)